MKLSYEGKSISDGSIVIEDLVEGLTGLSSLLSAVDENIRINVKTFEKGSFEAYFEFVQKNPVLFSTGASAILAVIGWFISYILRNKGTKNINNINIDNINLNIQDPNVLQIVSGILRDKKRTQKVKKGFHEIASPLSKDIDKVSFAHEKQKEIIDKEQRDYFIDRDIEEKKHRSIEMIGEMRSLDKKTNKGKFISDAKIYPFSLVMDNPENYHKYLLYSEVKIYAIAAYSFENENIEKIEIERIEPKS